MKSLAQVLGQTKVGAFLTFFYITNTSGVLVNKVLCWKCDSILLAFWKLWVCFPTQAVASSHYYRAVSCTPLTLPHLAFLRMPPLYYTFGVGFSVVPSLVCFSFFCIFSKNGVVNPDVLNCCWYAGDSQIYSSNPKFPHSLDLYFYYLLNISMDMLDLTHVPNQVCSSWSPVLVTITIYTGTPARNIYRLKFLLVSYQSAYHIFSTPTIFLEFGPFSPLCL